jgi:HAD superfamily hydrolase (TIGR01450 family)
VPGSPEAVADLRAAGIRVLFVTNNSAARIADQEQALAAIDIPAVGDVITSAMAGADLVAPGERALVVGGAGVHEALEARGAIPVGNDAEADGTFDVVVVGFHRDFDYERLRRAATAVLGGARLIGTNDDPTYPTPDGPIPGGGSLLAAVATAAGVVPNIAGKPHPPMAATVLDRLGHPDPATLVMVGDRWTTDGLFARALGCRFALVRSGVTEPGVALEAAVELDRSDLAGVAAELLGGPRSPGTRRGAGQ